MIYEYTTLYIVVEKTTCGELVDLLQLSEDEDCVTHRFIMKEGEIPVSVNTHWAWLRRQPRSLPVLLLELQSTKGQTSGEL